MILSEKNIIGVCVIRNIILAFILQNSCLNLCYLPFSCTFMNNFFLEIVSALFFFSVYLFTETINGVLYVIMSILRVYVDIRS